MELMCLKQFTTSLILATLSLIACFLRSEFLLSVLKDTTQPKFDVDGYINIQLYINLVLYMLWGLLSMLLIYAIIKERHGLMIPWLIIGLVSVCSEVAFVIYILATGHSIYVLFLLLGTALTLWIIWTIFSFYQTVRDKNLAKDVENVEGCSYSVARTIEIY